ncbi:MAG: hypothetical protein LBO77_03515 [Desulfovibrio sp.]|jgi:hypothetical protein|nr:hypothetical protein [Desulfovibrio sp.]
MKAEQDALASVKPTWLESGRKAHPGQPLRRGDLLWRRLLWWTGYVIAGLLLQRQFPGLDALAPGFLLALQERKTIQTLWLFLLFTLIQEGTGSLHFGMGMIWYGGQMVLFRLGSRLFVADNIIFVVLFSASLGVCYGVLFWLICALHDIPSDYAELFRLSLLQAAAIPIVWGLARICRPRTAAHAH